VGRAPNLRDGPLRDVSSRSKLLSQRLHMLILGHGLPPVVSGSLSGPDEGNLSSKK